MCNKSIICGVLFASGAITFPNPGQGQAPTCDGVKPVNWTSTLPCYQLGTLISAPRALARGTISVEG
jgi:hypothetical protein